MKIKYDSPFWDRMGKLYYIIVLNFMWILFSVPLITIGPSTVALHHCMFYVIKGKEISVFKEFYHAFKENFVRNMLIGLIVAGFGFLLIFSQNFYIEMATSISPTIYYFYIFVAFIFFMFLVYIFPVLDTFDGNILELLRLSLFLSIKNLPMSILMLIIDYFIIYFCQIVIPLVFIGVAFIVFVNNRIFLKRVLNSMVSE